MHNSPQSRAVDLVPVQSLVTVREGCWKMAGIGIRGRVSHDLNNRTHVTHNRDVHQCSIVFW